MACIDKARDNLALAFLSFHPCLLLSAPSASSAWRQRESTLAPFHLLLLLLPWTLRTSRMPKTCWVSESAASFALLMMRRRKKRRRRAKEQSSTRQSGRGRPGSWRALPPPPPPPPRPCPLLRLPSPRGSRWRSPCRRQRRCTPRFC